MKIKTKLYLGLIFLFLVLLIIGLVGYTNINTLAKNAKVVLKDNYESVQYIKNMHQALDAIENGEQNAYDVFENNLQKQEHNITEEGEDNATHFVRQKFDLLKNKKLTLETVHGIRSGLYEIEDLNTNAIVRKHIETLNTAGKAKFYMVLITTILLLFTFTFILNFPGYIANPIQELTEGINQIAREDYTSRLHFKSSDEFGDLAKAFNTMALQLETYKKSSLSKIMLEKKYIETLINSLKDPVIGFDRNNIIQFINPEASKILGLKDMDLIGHYAPDIALKNDLLRTLLQPTNTISPLRISTDKKEAYFTKEIYNVDIEHETFGNMILLRNVTAYQEQSLAKTNFIATISHELKTPISSIKMSLALLEDDRVGDRNTEQARLINAIKDDANRLLRITAELLDMAQIESGNIILNKSAVKPTIIADYALHAVKQLADARHINIYINASHDLPLVMCDPEKTAWVLINLLTNAIRYSHENSNVYVYISLEENHTRFSVKDSGAGIPPEYADKIFDKYFKVPGTESSKEGTGLGLGLAKEIIEAQNGRIEVVSEPGKGSVFNFYL